MTIREAKIKKVLLEQARKSEEEMARLDTLVAEWEDACRDLEESA